ncbi:MAG: hypothetical protein KBC02_02040 [Candidatus Pacebacteria bacterium]|nr:hypothetical protein [Candidatus Paceibacterota bacterium]
MPAENIPPPPRWVIENFNRPSDTSVTRECTLEIGELSSLLRQALHADGQTAPMPSEEIASISIVYKPHLP